MIPHRMYERWRDPSGRARRLVALTYKNFFVRYRGVATQRRADDARRCLRRPLHAVRPVMFIEWKNMLVAIPVMAAAGFAPAVKSYSVEQTCPSTECYTFYSAIRGVSAERCYHAATTTRIRRFIVVPRSRLASSLPPSPSIIGPIHRRSTGEHVCAYRRALSSFNGRAAYFRS